MPKLKALSGAEVIKILSQFGFSTAAQKGSHVKLVRIVTSGRQILTVPFHKELDQGTTKAIFNQASRFISADDLRPFFYSE